MQMLCPCKNGRSSAIVPGARFCWNGLCEKTEVGDYHAEYGQIVWRPKVEGQALAFAVLLHKKQVFVQALQRTQERPGELLLQLRAMPATVTAWLRIADVLHAISEKSEIIDVVPA